MSCWLVAGSGPAETHGVARCREIPRRGTPNSSAMCSTVLGQLSVGVFLLIHCREPV